jgi:hypothetical protein
MTRSPPRCFDGNLDLALFIHAQHHRVERWIGVKADDVAHLVNEQRIGGELECLFAMRLQPKGLSDAHYRRLRLMTE